MAYVCHIVNRIGMAYLKHHIMGNKTGLAGQIPHTAEMKAGKVPDLW